MATSQQTLHQIGVSLADSLATLETRSSTLAYTAVREAVIQTWRRLVDDAVSGTANLSEEYLADLHWQLATLAGGNAPGVFIDRGQPLLRDGQPSSWASFVEEASAEEPIDPAWVLAQLRWGEHVHSLPLSLGWLAMNVALLASDGTTIVPPIADHERLLRYLAYAGPDLYDAESLRALIGTYRAEQWQTENGRLVY